MRWRWRRQASSLTLTLTITITSNSNPNPNLTLTLTIEVLRPGASEDVPLYIAYNSRREEDLCSAFAAQGLERRRPLGYLSVKLKTQRQLFLYCPEGLGHNLGEEGALP